MTDSTAKGRAISDARSITCPDAAALVRASGKKTRRREEIFANFIFQPGLVE